MLLWIFIVMFVVLGHINNYSIFNKIMSLTLFYRQNSSPSTDCFSMSPSKIMKKYDIYLKTKTN